MYAIYAHVVPLVSINITFYWIEIWTHPKIFKTKLLRIDFLFYFRYFAVSHPYLHLINLTWKRAISVVVITWLASCMIALLPIVWNNVDWTYWATNGTTG